jgi:hypothetical protein
VAQQELLASIAYEQEFSSANECAASSEIAEAIRIGVDIT